STSKTPSYTKSVSWQHHLPVELDALNNKDISYAKDFFLYIETQLKIAKDFLDLEKKYQVLLQVKFFTHLLI
ncbi:hypothetical protein MZH72_19420, partial [Escherichia coli]|nr:hypothetical protein [Escherichia coli]